MFMGEYNHTIDAKGRLIIPSKFREQLGEEFVVTKGLDGCLFVFPKAEFEIVQESIRKLSLMDRDGRRFTRYLFAGGDSPEIDKQGRILLQQQLRDYADLQKDIVLVGVLNRIEIWNKERWLKENVYDDMDEIAQRMVELGLNI